MEPWQSWALAVALTGAAFTYYSQSNKGSKRAPQKPSTSDNPQNTAPRRRHDKRTRAFASAGDASDATAEDRSNRGSPAPKSSNKRKPRVDPSPNPAPAARSTTIEDSDDEQELGDSEWARQLNAAKQGVTLSAQNKPAKQKSKEAEAKSNGTPEAPAVEGFPSGRDVSDMLEPPAPGASVLRLTGEEKPKKAKPQQAAQEKETKKQRQNRKKVEEKKAVADEQERERQMLLEKQRRTAREARGEPAKNGLGPAAPASNAWSKAPDVKTSFLQPNGHASQPLLDTFERSTATTSESKTESNASSHTPASSAADQGLPSEETQMEMLEEMNGWNEVPKGKKNKKKAQALHSPPVEPGVREKADPFGSVSTSDLVGGGGVDKTFDATTNKKSGPNGFAALEAATSYHSGVKSHPDDSDWAVE